MRIGFTLDDVIRDYTGRFIEVYDKYVEKTEMTKEDVTDFDFSKFFKLKTEGGLNQFLYSKAAYEIFGCADALGAKTVSEFNAFCYDSHEEGDEVVVINREVGKARSATLFFLSKTAMVMDKIFFTTTHDEVWEHCDLLFTANPVILNNKPEGKTSVKIRTPYNKESKADFEYDSVVDFFLNRDLGNKIITEQQTNEEQTKLN